MVRLFIEAATFGDLCENWVWQLDEHDLIEHVGSELTIRAIPAEQKVAKPFTLSLTADTPQALAKQVKPFRDLAGARDFAIEDRFTINPVDYNWRHFVKVMRELITTGINVGLQHGGKLYLTRKFAVQQLDALVRRPGLSHRIRAEIHTTLADLEEEEEDDE